MDIQGIASRPSGAAGSPVNTPASSLTGQTQNSAIMNGVGTLGTPATTQNISSGGLFMRLMKVYENNHPDEAKAFLQGVADKLHGVADNAGTFARSLNVWGDKFQKAAETGDLSNLLPTSQPDVPFGINAYRFAQPTAALPPEVEAVIADSIPPELTEVAPQNPFAPNAIATQARDPNALAVQTLLDPNDPALLNANIEATNQAANELTSLSQSALPALTAVLDGSLTPEEATAALDQGLQPSASDGINLSGEDLAAIDASIAAASQVTDDLIGLSQSALPTLRSTLGIEPTRVLPEPIAPARNDASSSSTRDASNMLEDGPNNRII